MGSAAGHYAAGRWCGAQFLDCTLRRCPQLRSPMTKARFVHREHFQSLPPDAHDHRHCFRSLETFNGAAYVSVQRGETDFVPGVGTVGY